MKRKGVGKISARRIRGLQTRLRNLHAEVALLNRLLDFKDAEIEQGKAALARACAQLMGPLAPDAPEPPPRDTRTFPWDDADDPDLPDKDRSIADDQPMCDGCLTERDSTGAAVPLTPRRR